MPVSLPSAISRAWPRKPKPVTSVQAWISAVSAISSAAFLFSVVMQATERATSAAIGDAALEGRADDPRAERFGQDQAVPGFSAPG